LIICKDIYGYSFLIIYLKILRGPYKICPGQLPVGSCTHVSEYNTKHTIIYNGRQSHVAVSRVAVSRARRGVAVSPVVGRRSSVAVSRCRGAGRGAGRGADAGRCTHRKHTHKISQKHISCTHLKQNNMG